ncbi:MAG: hypothetical protein HC906_19630 [Bacteroidales bacterium]|nr:hypothetical protein [Bacteroidales bacterium]
MTKKRTSEKFKLPENDSVSIEMVSGKVWSAYNWYKGNGYSHIQVNTDRPFYAVDILETISHETYPGHHTHLSQQDLIFYKQNNWVEFSIQPLFAPLSLIAEGIAENAWGLIFTGKEAEEYIKEIILPLAGVDTTGYSAFYRFK